MELYHSLCDFAFGIVRRFWAFAPAFLLDPFDLWAKLFKPMLPEGQQFDLPWSSEWAPIFSFGLLGLAALLTFHEVRQKVVQGDLVPDYCGTDAYRYLLLDSKWAYRRDLGPDQHELASDALKVICDAASIGRLNIWGRPYVDFSSATERNMTKIPKAFWTSGQLDVLTFLGMSLEPPTAYRGPPGMERFDEIEFTKREFQQRWPEQFWLQKVFDKNRKKRKELLPLIKVETEKTRKPVHSVKKL